MSENLEKIEKRCRTYCEYQGYRNWAESDETVRKMDRILETKIFTEFSLAERTTDGMMTRCRYSLAEQWQSVERNTKILKLKAE